MFRFLKDILIFPFRPKKNLDGFVKKLVMRYSSGNVNLKMGRYTTEKELQKLKKSALRFKFGK